MAEPSSPSFNLCSSVDELQNHLRGLLRGKVSEIRAEHVSVEFQFRPTVSFEVPVRSIEQDSIGNLGPAFEGETAGDVDELGAQSDLQLEVNEVLMNQPKDLPILQKTIGKVITGAVSAVDASDWVQGPVSREPHGWTFTYMCESSMQAWSSQNPTNAAGVPVGEQRSDDGRDAVNMSMEDAPEIAYC
jgi:ATP-dependent DNA helicase 2 subunit 1